MFFPNISQIVFVSALTNTFELDNNYLAEITRHGGHDVIIGVTEPVLGVADHQQQRDEVEEAGGSPRRLAEMERTIDLDQLRSAKPRFVIDWTTSASLEEVLGGAQTARWRGTPHSPRGPGELRLQARDEHVTGQPVTARRDDGAGVRKTHGLARGLLVPPLLCSLPLRGRPLPRHLSALRAHRDGGRDRDATEERLPPLR